MRDIVDILQFAEVVPPRHHAGDHTNSIPEVHDGDHDYSSANIDNGFGESLEEVYDDGSTFLDLFDTDEYAECMVNNLYYPFASKEEWEVADYLLRLSLSMVAIDEFLKLSMVRAEMLPSGPSWKCQTISSIHPTKSPIRLFWRDPINPLFHDKLDFIPRRSLQNRDSAWEMQTQLPRGATVLGTILSSDKTNITTMTGARVAHPLLLGLANIRMCTRTKLSSKAFLLAALLPIPNIMVNLDDLEAYFEACADSRLNGVHAPFWMDRLLADPSIFLTPESLHHWHKEFYNHDLQWCIVVVGAQELDFRFSISQPTTGYRHFSGGISKLKQVTGRGHRDIQRYIIGLISGAAPRHFVITICALMDLRYLAQCPAPDDNLLVCINQSLLTFHEHKDVILTLGTWMGTKRPIENWHIPKLELLQSITSSTRKVGALIQWNPTRQMNNNDYNLQICHHLYREEKLRRFAIATSLKSHSASHDPDFRAEDALEEDGLDDEDEQETNDPQMALLEEMNHTRVATNYFSKARQMATVRRDSSIPYPHRTFVAENTAIHLNYNPSRTGVKVDDVSTDFNLPDLHVALSGFLQRDARERGIVHGVGGPRRRPPINHLPILPFDRVQLWDTVRLQQTSFHDPSIMLPAQTVHASPPGPGWPKGRRDTILVNVDTAYEWPQSGLSGSHITWQDQYLCYVQCLNIGPCDSATGMHVLKRAKHVDGIPIGSIIPLRQLCAFISIIPRLGDAADARLTSATSMHYSQDFFLNKYFDKDFYYALHYATTP
ncbi:hypothetical protein DFH29DRAFT_984627 [Suillus ampliporus]|nr:hypothetical protein DFH29DRAFT_984627 [Suillus ampliporus]